jgi:hypothetical protein
MEMKELLDRCEYTIDYQRQEIDKLRTEVQRLLDWIMGDANAHTALQAVYNDPTASQANKVKAAAAAIGYEQGKIRDEPPFLELRAHIPLLELAEMRMRKVLPLEGQEIQVQPNGQVIVLKPGRGNGNGDGSND